MDAISYCKASFSTMRIALKLLLTAAGWQLSMLPVLALPQWIDIGRSKSGSTMKVNFNSLKRDGSRVGFMGSISNGNDGYAAFTWVDCSTWKYVLAESDGPWLPIAADTLMDEAAAFVCKNSSQSRTRASGNQPKSASITPTAKGLRGKCTFLSSTGGKSLTDDPCRIDQQGSTTTLYWSDNVFTRIVSRGIQVEIYNPDGQPFIGRTVARSSIGKIIEYEKGTIGWCTSC